MPNLINQQDTLNQGRVKLNEAIKDAENAKVEAGKATGIAGQSDKKAEQAVAHANSIQVQLNELVIDGDSSVEAAQARVDESGVTHPTLKDRLDDGFNIVNNQLEYTNKLVIADIKNRLPMTFSKPSGFTFSKDVIIFRNGKSEYRANLSAEEFKPSVSGGTYYVDIKNGSNANDGLTPTTALRDAAYANTKYSPSEIIFMAGVYDRNEIGVPAQHKCVWRAMPGHEVILGVHESNSKLSWVQHSQGVYKTTRSAVNDVWDSKQLDADGLYTLLTKVNSISECVSTPGTIHIASDVLYVHRLDNSAPDNTLFVGIGVPGPSSSKLTSTAQIYFEGLKFYFGTSLVFTEKGNGSLFIAKDCEFSYRSTANGLNIEGYSFCLFERCKSNRNNLDGFNYHAANNQNGEVIEINCQGMRNGRSEGSHNGSTAHEAYKVVRVGGEYHSNMGDNVADVNDAQSWNVGVKASNSLGYKRDFLGNKMWLDSCYSTSETSFSVTNPANTDQVGYVRDSVLFGNIDSKVAEF